MALTAAGLPASAAGEPAEKPPIEASFGCQRQAGPGRLVCEVGLSSRQATRRFAWADVLVVVAPEFVRPLRSRVAAPAVSSDADHLRVPLGFVALREGTGEIEVVARAVVCDAGTDRGCRTFSRRLRALVRVHATSPEPPPAPPPSSGSPAPEVWPARLGPGKPPT